MHQLETIDTGVQPDATNPAAVYLARLSPGSRRTTAGALEWLAREASAGRCNAATLPWHLLRYQHTQVLRARALAAGQAPATVNKHVTALRGVLREAWRLGLMTAEEHARATDIHAVKFRKLPAGRALEGHEVAALFARCAHENGPGRVKDAAVLAVLFGAGLRRAELVSLDLADYHAESGGLRVRHGKGGAERLAWITGDAQRAVNDWIKIRGESPGPLFCAVHRCGRVDLRRVSTTSILLLVRRRASKAGVDQFSPHDCRRTFISALLDAGVDLSTVQSMAGHSSPVTTTRYDRRKDRTRKAAAELLHIPYISPTPAA